MWQLPLLIGKNNQVLLTSGGWPDHCVLQTWVSNLSDNCYSEITHDTPFNRCRVPYQIEVTELIKTRVFLASIFLFFRRPRNNSPCFLNWQPMMSNSMIRKVHQNLWKMLLWTKVQVKNWKVENKNEIDFIITVFTVFTTDDGM